MISTPEYVSKTERVSYKGVSFLVHLNSESECSYWAKFSEGAWEPETLDVLAAEIRPGSRFVDIGAWIGPTTLFAAAIGAAVQAYEPDPIARASLERNIWCNSSLERLIRVTPAALGTATGRAQIRSSILGDSMTSLTRSIPGLEEVTVDVVGVKGEVKAGNLEADFIKIDVEGFEFQLVPSLLTALPKSPGLQILLSIHTYPTNDALDDRAARSRTFRILPFVARRKLAILLLVVPKARMLWHCRRFRSASIARRNQPYWKHYTSRLRVALATIVSGGEFELWLRAEPGVISGRPITGKSSVLE